MVPGMMVGYCDAAHAGKVCRDDSLFGVLQNYAFRWGRAELLGRRQEYIRRGFDLSHIQPGDDHLKVMCDTETD